MSAAVGMTLRYGGSDYDINYPAGCYLLYNGNTTTVYLNPHPDGRPNQQAAPLCGSPPLVDTSYTLVGSGYCRGENSSVMVNGRVMTLTSEAYCAAECNQQLYCSGYAYVNSSYSTLTIRGRCYVYGQGLEEGIPQWDTTRLPSGLYWQGYRQANFRIVGSSNVNNIKCMRRSECRLHRVRNQRGWRAAWHDYDSALFFSAARETPLRSSNMDTVAPTAVTRVPVVEAATTAALFTRAPTTWIITATNPPIPRAFPSVPRRVVMLMRPPSVGVFAAIAYIAVLSCRLPQVCRC